MVVAAADLLMQSWVSSSHEVCGQLPCRRRCLTTATQVKIDNAVLMVCRQASGSNKGQPDVPTLPQTRLSSSYDRNIAGPSHPGPPSSTPSISERPWPTQQTHANAFGHNLPGLSTVPETQQQPAAPPAQQQTILRASSLQPQRSLQQSNVSSIKQRMTRAQSGQDPNILAERVKWSDRPVMSGHF